MAIRTVVTRGYGNGTFNGTIALVTTRGYAIGAAAAVLVSGDRLLGKQWTDPRIGKAWQDQRIGKAWQDQRIGKD